MIGGRIDSSFTTEQRDLFASGMVAEIGVNAYAVWSAIKFFADYNTGHAWPGMRTLGEKLGLSKSSVSRAVEALQEARLLRVEAPSTRRRGQTYIARERIAVRIGERVLCTIVLDYVPASLRVQLTRIEQSVKTGEHDPDAFANVEIIPGEGFEWDPEARVLRGRLPARDIPSAPSADDYHRQLGEQLLARMLPKK